jgi:uncharacterized MAPEG superfamily protein
MTTDLWMLVLAGLLEVSIPFIYLAGRLQTPGGLQWGLGNREQAFEGRIPAWAERAERAHANLTENLAPFAILVLTAHVSGKANALTALGAEIFLLGRIAHLLVYTAGITVVRTAVFVVASLGELLILIQLFR